ncbi:alpha/beta fold hydrolase [Ramlibacter monticola]|uniref:Proline iminopeptidase n=1 Tax=Ramlibacter monticola TaxID=1926872 RepID=A0A936Z0U0_9BURK|nr:alpha/beta fold hydrolase [Ramlibacter monticola]
MVHRLPVGGGHVLHVEEHGNPAGLPALVLHGGPGSGSSPLQRSFFDPARYCILCPDQRGAGQSTPRGRIEDNTLAHLLADLRLLRQHLRIGRWLVVGGSWGATLAVLHAADQPEAVSGLLLRNPFLARAADIGAFFAAAGLPESIVHVFATGPVAAQRAAAARWWDAEQRLEGRDPVPPADAASLARLVDRYRVQSHYLRHGCWLPSEGLPACCEQVPAIPVVILQGEDDAICPPEGAQVLQRALGARATLRLVPGAGHDPSHPAMAAAMREALRTFPSGPLTAGLAEPPPAALP